MVELPYSWKQELAELDVVVPVPKGTRGKDLSVVIARNKLSVGLKGKDKIMEGDLFAAIKVEESFWNIGAWNGVVFDCCLCSLLNASLIEDQQTVLIHFEKIVDSWWPHVLTHHPKIDTKKIQPENSKLSDLDGETRYFSIHLPQIFHADEFPVSEGVWLRR